MGRSDGRRFWTSYRDGHPAKSSWPIPRSTCPGSGAARSVLATASAAAVRPMPWKATFWTTVAMTGSQTTAYPERLREHAAATDNIYFRPSGHPGTSRPTRFFDGAESQTVSRRDEFHNFEINLIREQLAWACDSPWDIGWSVGIRYFRFQESLAFQFAGSEWRLRRLFQRYDHQQPGGPAVRLRRGLQRRQLRAAVHHAQGRHLQQLPRQHVRRKGPDRLGALCGRLGRRAGLSQFPRPRHDQRHRVPDANRRGRRLAVHAELERSRRLSRGGHHRHGLGRRSIPRSTCATRLKCGTPSTTAASCCTERSWGRRIASRSRDQGLGSVKHTRAVSAHRDRPCSFFLTTEP